MSGLQKRKSVVSNSEQDEPVLTEKEVAEVLEGPSSARGRVQQQPLVMNSTFFGLLAEFGEAYIPLEKVAPKYFGQSYGEARRNALARMLPCRAFRLGGQKSPWLISAADLAELIDRQRAKAG
jgi:hypothetical protein